MKTSVLISSLFFAAAAVLLGACASQNDIATNYYADGIYFDPEYSKALPPTETEQPETTQVAEEAYDYYEPGTYTSPYEQELPGSGWDNGTGFSNWYSPMGWSTSFNFFMGNSWGTPYGYPYDVYSPYGSMMYPPYYNPYLYNPYMMPYWGYNPYMISGWGPYNPMWGYPGGYYPGYYPGYPGGGYGNDFGGYFNGNAPNVTLRGGSNPRPVRNTTGLPGRGSGQAVPAKNGKTTTIANATNTVPAMVNEQRTTKRGTASSRLRMQVEQNQQRSYTGTYRVVTNTTDARQEGESRQLYQKTTGKEITPAKTTGTRVRPQETTSEPADRTKNLERQATRVLNTTGQRTQNSGTTRTNSSGGTKREYTPTHSGGNNSGGSARPSSGGGSRPSGGSSGGGRPSGGGSPTRR